MRCAADYSTSSWQQEQDHKVFLTACHRLCSFPWPGPVGRFCSCPLALQGPDAWSIHSSNTLATGWQHWTVFPRVSFHETGFFFFFPFFFLFQVFFSPFFFFFWGLSTRSISTGIGISIQIKLKKTGVRGYRCAWVQVHSFKNALIISLVCVVS